ncbi:MAG: protein-export chaperone SecB [Candidatus Jidaibacter sp.]|jgi:preprotein translocase subunit SecB|nr:protein-export chaperone SecB [Candidatus Jidaibacter sp.]
MDQEKAQGSFVVHGQYVRDLSFENPKAPFSFQIEEQPAFDVSVDVKTRQIDENNVYEVVLNIVTKAIVQNEPLFVVALEYAGIFQIETTGDSSLERVLLVDCPNMLYPYARRIVSDATRDGGYPAVSLNPMDFLGLYLQRKSSENSAQESSANIN